MSMWVFQTFSARANLKRRLKERERSESKRASCIRCLFFYQIKMIHLNHLALRKITACLQSNASHYQNCHHNTA